MHKTMKVIIAVSITIFFMGCTSIQTRPYPVKIAVIDKQYVEGEAKRILEEIHPLPANINPETNPTLREALTKRNTLQKELRQKESFLHDLEFQHRAALRTAPSQERTTPSQEVKENAKRVVEEKAKLEQLIKDIEVANPSLQAYEEAKQQRHMIAGRAVIEAIKRISENQYDTVYNKSEGMPYRPIRPMEQGQEVVFSTQIVMPPNITWQVIQELNENKERYFPLKQME